MRLDTRAAAWVLTLSTVATGEGEKKNPRLCLQTDGVLSILFVDCTATIHTRTYSYISYIVLVARSRHARYIARLWEWSL